MKGEFKDDLLVSEADVDKLMELLTKRGHTCLKSEGYNPDWDLRVQHAVTGNIWDMEVKHDHYWGTTRNGQLIESVCFEVECKGKPSCAMVSQADYMVYLLGNTFWIARMSEVRQMLCDELFGWWETMGGENKASRLRIIPWVYFLNVFKQL